MRSAGLGPRASAHVASLVFGYYRWLRWLDTGESLNSRLLKAQDLTRKYAREPASFTDAEITSKALPDWLRNQMRISPAFARAMQAEPQLWLRCRPGCGGEVLSGLPGCKPAGTGLLSNTLSYHGEENLYRHPLFQNGVIEIQDVSSQAVCLVCAPAKGEKWWDACAGEGGKTLHLSQLMENTGLILCSDRAEWRLRKLKVRVARAKVFNYRTAHWEGGEKLPTKTLFDGVLVDAPCSGVGTWHRNPHARWSVTEQDVEELAALQVNLLLHASQAVKPGGRLIYAVCTLTKSETTSVAQHFTRSAPGFEEVEIANPLVPGSGPAKHLWLWPQNTHGNGMFVAMWRRLDAGKAS